MQIDTKYNVNQKVFCIDKERRIIKKPCNICNGRGTIKLKGHNGKWKDYKCPECFGNGCGECKLVYVVHEAIVNRIRIGIKEKVTISYRCIYDRDKDLHIKEKCKETSIADYENRIFATIEEAEAVCVELNGEEFNNGKRQIDTM